MTSWANYCDFMKNKGMLEEIMIVSSSDGSHWASSPDTFMLREYTAMIAQEDGIDKEQTVNEATNLISFMSNNKPEQGLRLNGKKQTIIRNFKDEKTGGVVIYGKVPQGGSCIADGGRCIVIGTFSELKNQNSTDCNDLVTLMARYLKDSTWPNGLKEGDVDASSGGSKTWQPFIDTMLIGKGNVAQAMICNRIDGKLWASTKDFALQCYEAGIEQDDGTEVMTPIDESKGIVSLMNAAAGFRPPGGIRIASVKYLFVKGFDDESAKCLTVYGKKTKGGCCLVATKLAIIITTFDEGMGHTAAACNLAVSDLAKYLASLGY